MSEEIKDPILPEESDKVKTDKKVRTIMMWATIAIALVVIGTIAYIYGYKQPAVEKGNEAIGNADRIALFEPSDSTALAAYEEVAANNGFAAGNRAKLQSAILLYRQGEYQKALDYLNSYDTTDDVIGATALALKGDCLVNLDKYADAVKAFDNAISQCNDNPLLMPYLLNKKGTVLAALEDYKAAAACYRTIETEYPGMAAQFNAKSRTLQYESLANGK